MNAKERAAEKAKLTVERRAKHFQQRIKGARTEGTRLAEVCQYLRAVAKGLPAREVTQLTQQVLRLANERNKP
jgi:hypothetical protein